MVVVLVVVVVVAAGLFCPPPGFPPNVCASCRTLGSPLKAFSEGAEAGVWAWGEEAVAATEGCEEACVSRGEGEEARLLWGRGEKASPTTGCEEAGEGVMRIWERLRGLWLWLWLCSPPPLRPAAPITRGWGWTLRELREEEEATPPGP